jgi:hypothetical protein
LKQLKENRGMAVIWFILVTFWTERLNRTQSYRWEALDCAGMQYLKSAAHCYVESRCYLTVPMLGNHRNFSLYLNVILAFGYRA